MKKLLKIKCPAKVNLTLDVVRRRNDGYHELDMVMHTVKLFDILDVSVSGSDKPEITLSSDNVNIPTDQSNHCFKAADLFLSKTGLSKKVSIDIKKNIPVAAGLGGGSSDAAGTLLALNKLCGFLLSASQLAELAKKIGADVPFFLYGGCMRARGIGEILSPLPALDNAVFVIAKPQFGVSTPFVYKSLDLANVKNHPDVITSIDAISKNDLSLLGRSAGNVLETVVLPIHPEIDEYKKILTENGAVYSLMSGSGSSVFGVFENVSLAKKAISELKKYTKLVFLA